LYNEGKKRLYHHSSLPPTVYYIIQKCRLVLHVSVTVLYYLITGTNAGKYVSKVQEVSKRKNKYDIGPVTTRTTVRNTLFYIRHRADKRL